MTRPNHRCLNDTFCYCSNPKIEHASSCSRGAALCRFKALHSEIGPTMDENRALYGGIGNSSQPDATTGNGSSQPGAGTTRKNPKKKS